MRMKSSWALAMGIAMIVAGTLWAVVTTVPASSLIPSTTLYTDIIGGGIGPVVATGSMGAAGRNDDGSSNSVPLGFTLNFFGGNYSQFFINNNGNITFNDQLSDYTPNGPQGASEPIISPYFADVDTRNASSGVVHLRNDIPNELIITWPSVGYFDTRADRLNSFQLVLRGPGFSVPAGEGSIGFFYTTMQWEVGEASGGVNGFCPGAAGSSTDCFPAAVGFGDGASNGVTLAGSLQNGIAATLQNHHIWFNLSGGVPVTAPTGPPTAAVPALSNLALIGLGVLLFGVSFWMRRGESSAA